MSVSTESTNNKKSNSNKRNSTTSPIGTNHNNNNINNIPTDSNTSINNESSRISIRKSKRSSTTSDIKQQDQQQQQQLQELRDAEEGRYKGHYKRSYLHNDYDNNNNNYEDSESAEHLSLLPTTTAAPPTTITRTSANMVTPTVPSGTGRRSASSSTTTAASLLSAILSSAIVRKLLDVLAILYRFILLPIRYIQLVLFPFRDIDEISPAVTAKSAQQFVAYLKSLPLQIPNTNSRTTNTTTGNTAARDARIDEAWSLYGYETAKQEAIRNQCLLLVYIHSPLHRYADDVAVSFLNSDPFFNFVSQQENNKKQVIAIGVSIHTAQGSKLANLLHITSYPAVVLLQPEREAPATTGSNNESSSSARSNSTIPMQLLIRAESKYNLIPQKLLPHFETALTRHQVVVAEREMKRLARQQEIELRKQQDEEYYATLIADQEREQQLQREQLEKEQALREALLAEENKQKEYERKKSSIRDEPKAGTESTSIRFVLSNGTKINRKFYKDDTIEIIRNYIQIYCEESSTVPSIGTVGLSTNFPKKSFNDSDQTRLTLDEAGLCPQAVLMVQDLDL